MKTVDFLKEEEFPGLLMLIKKFADSTETPFHLHVNEVSASLLKSRYLTIVTKDDEKDFPLIAYLCGFTMDTGEFMISQVYSEEPDMTPIFGDFLEEHLRSLGIKKIFGLFKHNPRVVLKYGYKLERYLVGKEI